MNTKENHKAPPELKPCPCCGSTATEMNVNKELNDYWFIECDSCGLNTPASNFCDPRKVWNTRASAPAAEAKCVLCGHVKRTFINGECRYQIREVRAGEWATCGCHCEFPTTTASKPVDADADNLHLAICQAVHLMNQGDLHAGHDLLRQTLVDYADKKAPLSRSEIIRQQQQSRGDHVTAVMVSPTTTATAAREAAERAAKEIVMWISRATPNADPALEHDPLLVPELVDIIMRYFPPASGDVISRAEPYATELAIGKDWLAYKEPAQRIVERIADNDCLTCQHWSADAVYAIAVELATAARTLPAVQPVAAGNAQSVTTGNDCQSSSIWLGNIRAACKAALTRQHENAKWANEPLAGIVPPTWNDVQLLLNELNRCAPVAAGGEARRAIKDLFALMSKNSAGEWCFKAFDRDWPKLQKALAALEADL